MDALNIELFEDDGSTIKMPSISPTLTDEQSQLISDDISHAIDGDEVKTLILPEDNDIAEKNFIFDFSDIETISQSQTEAIKALLSIDGDIQLYLYRKQTGLTYFGSGNKYTLERIIPLIRTHVFEDGIRVYKDFKRGNKVEEVTSRDITKMRLHL